MQHTLYFYKKQFRAILRNTKCIKVQMLQAREWILVIATRNRRQGHPRLQRGRVCQCSRDLQPVFGVKTAHMCLPLQQLTIYF